MLPFGFPVRLRRHDRRHPQVADEPAGLVALAGAVHRQRRARDRIGPALRQGTAFGRVVGLAAGQAENHCLPITCGDHVDLRVPTAARLADALRPVRLPRPGAVGMHLGAGPRPPSAAGSEMRKTEFMPPALPEGHRNLKPSRDIPDQICKIILILLRPAAAGRVPERPVRGQGIGGGVRRGALDPDLQPGGLPSGRFQSFDTLFGVRRSAAPGWPSI